MNSQLTAYITLICTSGVLNLYLCLNVFLRRQHYSTIAQYFIVYSASITFYCFASAFGLMATSLDQIKIWTSILYIGMPASSPLGLLFIIKYLGVKITKKRWIALLAVPFISLIMVATNDFHHLHYRVFEVDPSLGAPYVHLEIGLWYMIHGVYTFGCMFVAFFLGLSRWKETAKVYRPQLIALLFGQLVPMVTAFLYLIGMTPSGIDPVPMVLWLTSLLYLYSINSSRLFSVMPIAKDAIFNSINDGVMVLDDSYRLIEYNQACERMFSPLSKTMYGMDFINVWGELTGDSFPAKLENAPFTMEIGITCGHSRQIYQLRVSSLIHENSSKGLLIIFSDITELKRLQEQLEHQAYYDELTQIYNRRAFFMRCGEWFAASRKVPSPFTVMLFDIDYFKKVNDTYGHNVGDQLLKYVVQVCQSQLKDDMLFARYGGEEFVLALKGYSAFEGETFANHLRMQIQSQPLMTVEGSISVTISIGVAQAEKESEETLYQLLNKADKALYQAKHAGRNNVKVY